MLFQEILRKKRDGFALTEAELQFFADAAATGSVPDYQLSAMLMAMYLNGLNEQETALLTLAMARSGETADLSSIEGLKADKHSTGGVGDKTTLIVAPIVAACGVKMAKMSGRGLGHTGGTVDKMEAIPGMRTALQREAFLRVVRETGLCVVGQSGSLCPADKALYALRDVTETVSSLPLIASSIMSKKLAGGADCIVLDVKCGSGAFMKTKEDARALAESMVSIGKHAGKRMAAVLTNMDVPLGFAVGNAVEVCEAIDVLSGKGPEDLRDVALTLAAKILSLCGKGTFDACKTLAENAIETGAAKQKLMDMVHAQGGDESYITRPQQFPVARYRREVCAPESGFVTKMDTEAIGEVCVLLGAGRRTKEDAIDPAAGIMLQKKTGDNVEAGDVLATLLCNDEEKLEEAGRLYLRAVTIGAQPPEQQPLILDIVE